MSIAKPSAPARKSRCSGPIVVPETDAPRRPRPRRPRRGSCSRATRRSRCSATSMPRSSAITGALTKLTASSTRPWKAPFSAATVSRRVSCSASGAVYGDARSGAAGRRRARSRAGRACAASGTNGPSTSRSSAPTTGMLTAFVTTPPSSARRDLLGDDHARRGPAPPSVEAARCGVTTTLSSSSSGPVYGSVGKTSSAAPADLARAERLGERVLVDELAARGVDDPHAVAHLRDRVRVDRGRASRRSAAGAA